MNQYKDDNKQHNSIYYNQMLRATNRETKVQPKKKDFASTEVDFSKYLIVPSEYKGIAYTLYLLAVPYIVGINFLFFYIAEAVYAKFSLLDLNSFLIVRAIGYEISGAIILIVIFFAFLKHLKQSDS